jgi:hypothetical protein
MKAEENMCEAETVSCNFSKLAHPSGISGQHDTRLIICGRHIVHVKCCYMPRV